MSEPMNIYDSLKNSNLYLQNQYLVSYNQKDFFWNSINTDTNNKNVTEIKNTSIPTYCDIKFTKNPTTTYTEDCTGSSKSNCALFLEEICNNYKNSKIIKELQTTHSGADSRHLDTTKIYNYNLLKTFNLGIGIVYISIMLYYNNKK
jgi:hypothetical protein